jgi:hypothetical protein
MKHLQHVYETLKNIRLQYVRRNTLVDDDHHVRRPEAVAKYGMGTTPLSSLAARGGDEDTSALTTGLGESGSGLDLAEAEHVCGW